MRVEVMIYIYGAVCASMIVFNMIYNLLLKSSEPRLNKRSQKMAGVIQLQIERVRRGEAVEESHIAYLQHKLRRIKYLIAFDRVLKPLVQDGMDPFVQDYLTQIQSVALYLGVVYGKRENTQAAYFSYILSRYMLQRHMDIQSIQEVLLEYVEKDNLYCRVNGLQALYAFGNVDHILTALKLQDSGEIFIHEKILTEGLLSFTGDHDALIHSLWDELSSFSEHTQLAILNYIRFRSGAYTREMFAIMQNERMGKELRLAAIRYFGRYPYEPALEPLLAFAEDSDPLKWEYTTVSVSALAGYPGERVIDALKNALHSANWYVRYAAAVSLEALQVTYDDLIDIMNGNDRYAREMITYRLESRRMQKASV